MCRDSINLPSFLTFSTRSQWKSDSKIHQQGNVNTSICHLSKGDVFAKIGAFKEKCEPIPNPGEKRGREEKEESGAVKARLPLMFEEYKEPKDRRKGINRYILCNVGEEEICVCHVRVCVWVCVVCVCLCVVCPFSALSDGDSEFFQHTDAFLLVLLPGQPEVVLVLHDVS